MMVKVVVEFGVPGGSSLCGYCGRKVNAEKRFGYIDWPAQGGYARYHYTLCESPCYEEFRGRHQNFVEESI